VEEFSPGERFVVHPGEALPLDGVVVSGRSSLDQCSITGEAQPVSRGPGDVVACGTLNLEGVLVIEASSRASDSSLARVIQLVESAQSERSLASSERFAARVGRYYTPAVLAACAARFGWLMLYGAEVGDALYRSLALLIAASPCALVLSSPAAICSALAGAARRGLLVRSGSVLEALSKVDAVVFDKTGTLTRGTPRFHTVWADDGNSARLLRLAAAAELPSPHPLARAIVREARMQGITIPASEDHRTESGRGVSAKSEGIEIRAGRPEWFAEYPEILSRANAEREAGRSVVCIRAGLTSGVISFEEDLRDDAAQSVEQLRKTGVRDVYLLTGDHPRAAARVCEALPLSGVHADLLPEDKAAHVMALQRNGRSVAMVGDGINDAPALAHAAAGIALGGIGSDVALETADVVIMDDRLLGVSEVIALAKRARSVVVQNLVVSLLSVALLSLSVLWTAVPLPVAVIGHEGTTLVVVINGLRLMLSSSRRDNTVQ
jgi:heavy metal translocating P-type ATPase